MEMPNVSSNNMEEPLLTTDFEDMTIKYRLFKTEDSPGLIELENEASQHFTFFGLIKVGTLYRESFEMKSKQFQDYLILVAEATHKTGNQRTEVCGCVCLGIKDMYFSGALRKSGALYDLRVSERYQRKGIGSNLCKVLEKVAVQKGCEFIYLSVNNSNNKAIFLYDKLGYELISSRRIRQFIVPTQRNEVAPTTKEITHGGKKYQLFYERLSRDDTLKFYTEFYGGQDLALGNWNELIDSPCYLGTYAVRTSDNNNIAGMMLWKMRKSGSMGIRKLFVDISHYNKTWLIALGLAIIYACLWGPFNSLRAWPQGWGLSSFQTNIIGFILLVLPMWLIGTTYLFVNKGLRQFGGYNVRGRVIGPFLITKDEEIGPELLEFLSERIGTTAANEDLWACTYNSDSGDTLGPRIPGISRFGGSTRFMGKILKEGVKLKNYQMSKFSFFDPRDL